MTETGAPSRELEWAPLGALDPDVLPGAMQSPEQLARKFAHLPGTVIPMTRVWLDDFDVVYATHVTRYGSIPGNLHACPGAQVRLSITWLDDAQLQVMHATEIQGENYCYARLDGVRIAIEKVGDAFEERAGEMLAGSDAAAVVSHTREVVYLDDGEMVVMTSDGFHTATIEHERVDKEVHEVEWDLAQIEKGGFAHFMLKEIHEQPEAVRETLLDRLHDAGARTIAFDSGDRTGAGLEDASGNLKPWSRAASEICRRVPSRWWTITGVSTSVSDAMTWTGLLTRLRGIFVSAYQISCKTAVESLPPL